MSRYDKYEPYAGGFRALLAADWASGDVSVAFGVGLNSSGLVVKGAGQSGIVGVLVLTDAYKSGYPIDVMTDGEIVEFGGAAGTVYYADESTGVLSTTNTGIRIGHTVEASRLVVRTVPKPGVVA